MATTGVAIKGGKLLLRGGKINITAASDCDNCCCLECIHCLGCSVAEEPNCANCGSPAGCCTPCELEVVVSGVDAGRCTGCLDLGGTLGGVTAKVNSLAVDGTFCVQQTKESCVWEFLIVDAINITGFTGGFCNTACETENFDMLIQVSLDPAGWTVRIGETGTPKLCNVGLSFAAFVGPLATGDCKSAFGPVANTLGPCSFTALGVVSDTGTVSHTICCP